MASRRVDDAEHQHPAALGEHPLDPRDEGGEERIGRDDRRVARHDEAHRERDAGGEGAGREAGPVAELGGHAEDPLAGVGRDARPVVERERDERLAHAGLTCNVEDRRSARHGSSFARRRV
jgi:hypothetical protein